MSLQAVKRSVQSGATVAPRVLLGIGFLVLVSASVSIVIKPWGCSLSSPASAVGSGACDWTTSKVIAGVWLGIGIVGLVIGLRNLAVWLGALGAVLALLSFSAVGVYTSGAGLAWLASGIWLGTTRRPQLAWVAVLATLAAVLAIATTLPLFFGTL